MVPIRHPHPTLCAKCRVRPGRPGAGGMLQCHSPLRNGRRNDIHNLSQLEIVFIVSLCNIENLVFIFPLLVILKVWGLEKRRVVIKFEQQHLHLYESCQTVCIPNYRCRKAVNLSWRELQCVDILRSWPFSGLGITESWRDDCVGPESHTVTW